jgi:hypothetical protein
MKTRGLLPIVGLVVVLAQVANFAQGAPRSGGELAAPELSLGRVCGTPQPTPAEMEQAKAAVDRWLSEHATEAATGGRIKVAFHVIYSGSEGNLSDQAIAAQIAALNDCYAGARGGANTGYTFELASVDRTRSSKWFRMTPGSAAEQQAKQALALDIPHRLNLYTCKPGQNLLGWSYFPGSYTEGDWHHGVVVHYASLPGGSLSRFNLGFTAVHEAGHYLGLYHTFQGGCSAPGDYVSDTPDEGTSTSGCPSGKDTCPTAGLDPIHNYMDYSDDPCYTEFTSGQDSRMDGIVPVYRPSLLNAARLQTIARSNPSPAGAPDPGVAFRGAHPNPFGDRTSFDFVLARGERVSLSLYTVAGQRIRTVLDQELPAGAHSVSFRAEGLPAGTYYGVLRVGELRLSRSVILIR